MNRVERRGIDDATAIGPILHTLDPHDALVVMIQLRRSEGFIQGVDDQDDYENGFWSYVDDNIGEDDDDDGDNGDEDVDDDD